MQPAQDGGAKGIETSRWVAARLAGLTGGPQAQLDGKIHVARIHVGAHGHDLNDERARPHHYQVSQTGPVHRHHYRRAGEDEKLRPQAATQTHTHSHGHRQAQAQTQTDRRQTDRQTNRQRLTQALPHTVIHTDKQRQRQ